MSRSMQRLTAIFLMCCSITGGCASKYGEQKTAVNYYPACYAPIQDLRDREYDVGKTTGGGAVMGALAGALIGLLASRGKVEGALVGAAAGGATGAVAGNIYAKKQRQHADNSRMAAYMQAIDGDISALDISSAAARSSLQCYDRQFEGLLTAIREKKIDRNAACVRFAEISSGREEAIALLGDAALRGRDLDQRYEEAFRQDEQLLTAQASRQAGRNAASSRAAATQLKDVRQKKRQLTATTEKLTREKATAEEVSAEQLDRLQKSLLDINA